MNSLSRYRVFIGVTPRLEHILQKELNSLGIDPKLVKNSQVKDGEGGVELLLTLEQVWKVALFSRVAEALRVRIGSSFHCNHFDEFRKGLLKLPWKVYLPFKEVDSATPIQRVPSIQVVTHKSKLYHTGAVKERLVQHLVSSVYGGKISSSILDMESISSAKLHVRILNDVAQVSIDASGELLYKRTEGKHVTEAPIRETIAAACLYAADYKPKSSIWDPFVGSGTIIQEAMGITIGGAVSTYKLFAFQLWRTHPSSLYQQFLSSLPKPIYDPANCIFTGSDIDPRAIDATAYNAKVGGYELLHPRIVKGDFDKIEPSIRPNTMIVTNLPYGHRLMHNDRDALFDTYKRFGRMLERRKDFQDVIVLNGNPNFVSLSSLKWNILATFSNRGINVNLLKLIR